MFPILKIGAKLSNPISSFKTNDGDSLCNNGPSDTNEVSDNLHQDRPTLFRHIPTIFRLSHHIRRHRMSGTENLSNDHATTAAESCATPRTTAPGFLINNAPAMDSPRISSAGFLSVSQMVRQSSDTTHNNRRLMRSMAVDNHHHDTRPATSACTLAVDDNTLMMQISPTLQRPTRLVTVVDQQANENYIQLNQYRLMEEIGQGSYGIVKLAYNERDKNLYAMKVLDKLKLVKNFACFRPPPARKNKAAPSAVHKNPLQLVQKEIAILKKLSHPNVVKLVEVLDDPNDNYLYMVFEYVERRSLLELPTENPLDEQTAWKYFRDTLKGLEYLHFQKIVHRDIKPSNLLLSDTGQVKIADFGVSCEFEGIDAFLTGTAGTPAFMAPEALTEDSSHFYSGRAQDIWSLGITLYALVYGIVPFWDAYVIALHKKIKNDPVNFPESPIISDEMKELILGMLKKDPGHRLLLQELKENVWVTRDGSRPMSSEEDNCQLVTVTEEEIENCVRVIPRLDTLILVKAMGHRKRFGNPFRKERSGTNSSQSLKFRRKSSSVKEPIFNMQQSASPVSPSVMGPIPPSSPREPSEEMENHISAPRYVPEKQNKRESMSNGPRPPLPPHTIQTRHSYTNLPSTSNTCQKSMNHVVSKTITTTATTNTTDQVLLKRIETIAIDQNIAAQNGYASSAVTGAHAGLNQINQNQKTTIVASSQP